MHHRYATVDGRQLFYREAGSADAPTSCCCTGIPTSSLMFRDLIPLLADTFHVIAPDHLGFGLSDAPPADEFAYTFDLLADLTASLLEQLGVDRYAIYVQDYGAPIGWRLALRDPRPGHRDHHARTATATTTASSRRSGTPVWAYAREQTPETERDIRQALTLDAVRWQYLHGVSDPALVSPETWQHDFALVSRPGNDAIQLALFRDYATNPPQYPALQRYLRDQRHSGAGRLGRATTRSSGPTVRRAFARDAAGRRRSICSTAATSCSRARSTRSPR